MDDLHERLRQLHDDWTLATKQVAAEQQALQDAETAVVEIVAAQQLVQEVAQHLQHKAHARISAIVSRCLEHVFAEDAYTFQIRFDKKRGKTEAVLTLCRDGQVLDDPLTEAGGGCVEVAAFGLRLACLVLSTPRCRQILICDEPFRCLNGEEYQNRVGALLLALARDLKMQMIIVTDDAWLKIGKVVDLGQ